MKPSNDSIGENHISPASLNYRPVEPKERDKGKRTDARRYFSLPLEISYINKEERSDAQLIDCCVDGMCIRSRTGYKPGTNLVVRVKNFKSIDADTDFYEGPRSINLVDVKWCEEIIDDERPYFKVGLQLLPPVY